MNKIIQPIQPTEKDIIPANTCNANNYVAPVIQKGRPHIIELILSLFTRMFTTRTILSNLIALMMIGFALYFVNHQKEISWISSYHQYFTYALLVVAGLQVIRSASRSLILPILALGFGYIAHHNLAANQLMFGYGKTFYAAMTIVGLIGVIIAIFSIE